jgi:hypothetical protein
VGIPIPNELAHALESAKESVAVYKAITCLPVTLLIAETKYGAITSTALSGSLRQPKGDEYAFQVAKRPLGKYSLD